MPAPGLWTQLPDAPGVYLMVDRRGRVLYVGRSRRLRTRVRSYWTSPDPFRAHLDRMLRRVARVDHVACASLHDAAFLERELIARHEPPFNLTYGVEAEWWLRLDPAAAELEAVRQPGGDGARYFGPYLGGRRVRLALAALRRLRGHDVAAVLEGRSAAVAACLAELARKRDLAAEATLFEAASALQETIRAIEWLAQASVPPIEEGTKGDEGPDREQKDRPDHESGGGDHAELNQGPHRHERRQGQKPGGVTGVPANKSIPLVQSGGTARPPAAKTPAD